MRLYILPVLFILCLGCNEQPSYIIENATVVNLQTGDTNTLNLVIRGTRIVKTSVEDIKGSRKVDLKGKFLIPALWDMHVHMHSDKALLSRYFKQGVLGLRDMGAFNPSEVDSLMKWKDELRQDPNLRRPDIVYVGLINNDTVCYGGHRHVATYEDLIKSVDYLVEIGSSFYKIHNCFPYELLPQLDSLAAIHKFVFGGHIPEGIDPLIYTNQFRHLNSIEHISVLLRALTFRSYEPLDITGGVKLLDGPYLDSLAIAMKEKSIYFTPNLLSEVAFINSYPEEQRHLGNALMTRYESYVNRMANQGVPILAGTDNGLYSDEEITLYQELELLSKAGLTNLQVLQAATINADKAFGRRVNLLAENTEANFIILDANPLENLVALKKVYGIVHKGHYTELQK